jgi:3-deoxy-D-manno-octulosonic-acid transferase
MPIILGDTMGELRKFYSFADVVFVGRTLVDLGPRQHGSDMIEPAALAKPVIVGPYTGNFTEVMNRFRAAGAMREIRRGDELATAVREILSAASAMGARAQQVVRENQGATTANAAVVDNLLNLVPEDEDRRW